jgi:hypothetical protein
MKLVLEVGKWRIEGQGRERARLDFACIKDDKISYEVGESFEAFAGPGSVTAV